VTEIQQTPSAEGGGTEMTRFNALRHGVLSRYTVLPWEDADEYRALLTALVARPRFFGSHLPCSQFLHLAQSSSQRLNPCQNQRR